MSLCGKISRMHGVVCDVNVDVGCDVDEDCDVDVDGDVEESG